MISELLQVNLLKELGLDTLPKEKQDALVQQMVEAVGDRLNVRVMALLSDEDQKTFADKAEQDEGVEEFLSEKIPTLDLVVAEVIADFKREMLGLGAAVDDALAQNASANKV